MIDLIERISNLIGVAQFMLECRSNETVINDGIEYLSKMVPEFGDECMQSSRLELTMAQNYLNNFKNTELKGFISMLEFEIDKAFNDAYLYGESKMKRAV